MCQILTDRHTKILNFVWHRIFVWYAFSFVERNKVRVNNSTKRKFAICKVVQRVNWAGVADYEKVPLLQASNKRSVLKLPDVKSVEHKGQKVLT